MCCAKFNCYASVFVLVLYVSACGWCIGPSFIIFSLYSFMQFSLFVCLLLQFAASILRNWWWATLWIFSMELFSSTNYVSMTFPSCLNKKDMLILENLPSFLSLMEPHCLCKVVLL